MKKTVLLLVIIHILFSCTGKTKNNVVDLEDTTNDSVPEKWTYLFDGSSTDGWRAYNGDSLPSTWYIENGVLRLRKNLSDKDNHSLGVDIIYTKESFDKFELVWDWKISEGGNSGILYHVQEGNWNPSDVAPEYQLLDDGSWEVLNQTKLEEWHKTGADYAMYAPNDEKRTILPAGVWNNSKILFIKYCVEHWLNGKKVLSFVPWSEDWFERKNDGKWKEYPMYGSFKDGFVVIRDYNSPISFRSIKIRNR